MISQQSPAILYVVYIAVFVGALLVFEGLRQLLSRTEDVTEARNRRMRMMARGASPADVLNLLRDDPGKSGALARLSTALRQSGLAIGLPALGAIAFGLGAVALVVASRFLPPMLAALLSAAVALLVPMAVIGGARKRRMEKLSRQLPEALDLMARGLKVGHPLNVTIGSVASDMPDPIGTEFGIVQDQVSYGDTIVDALADMADRLDIEDVRYLAVSVGIQHGSGGNLARVLQVLSKIIRDRAMMRKKIKAISAEGRFSALILSGLPFAIFGMISATTPSYYSDVWDDPLFLPAMLTILTLVALQAAILYRMVNFKF
jgi:tight adherence protein B